MWYESSVFYQIYPLGLTGAPLQNDGITKPRILQLENWITHIQSIGANAIYLCPIFESDTHGYDTKDYTKIDCRLGTNADFTKLCKKLHANDIKIVLDGVFNHVGRGFWAFVDVQKNRETSLYKDWFFIDFNGNSNYNDGFWYEGWEGHFELVKLNLQNPAVVEYLLQCVQNWMSEFDIDGLRLDVAYSLNEEFLRKLRTVCTNMKHDFFLVGEMLHGDYNRLVNPQMLHSCTNYECYKGLYSSFNSQNMFEIAHSIARQFGPEDWTLYRDKHLFNFVDNHDVSRIASLLENENHLPLIYGLLFAMPGVPCIYYGSEWGAKGNKSEGDNALRCAYTQPQSNALTQFIATLATIFKTEKALQYGAYKMLFLTNQQYIFERSVENERIVIAINMDSNAFYAQFSARAQIATNLFTNTQNDIANGYELPPYSVTYWKL